MRGAPNRRVAIRQTGIALFVVLIAVLSVSLAAVALIRSVDLGSLVVGNLAFKQMVTAASDSGTEAAITWLGNNNTGSTLFCDNANSAYSATSLTALDATGHQQDVNRVLIDWDDGDDNNPPCAYATTGTYSVCRQPSPTVEVNGYAHQYFITRMCKQEGDPNTNQSDCGGGVVTLPTANNCAKPLFTASSESDKRGEIKYGDDKRLTAPPGPFYRIVVRSVGPRNTTSITETYVHF